jgi:nucleotide-binding universal stress UspA family protein
MKTIIAALDLEAGSDAVLARAIQLASAHAAWLLLLHVIEAESLSHAAAASGRSESDLQDQMRQQALATIEASLLDHGRARRNEVRVEFGSPHEVIARVIDERSVDLVVVGPHKRQSLKEKVLGSTADRVIRTSPAPVLVVRRASVEPYQEMVAAVDFSPQSAAAVRQARKLAPEAKLQLVHAVEVPLTFEQSLLRVGTSQAQIEEYRSVRTAKARDELAAFARDIAGDHKVSKRLIEGAPGPALVRISRGRSVDLLALGPHGRGVVLQALLGSVTQRVLREAECDILVATTLQ